MVIIEQNFLAALVCSFASNICKPLASFHTFRLFAFSDTLSALLLALDQFHGFGTRNTSPSVLVVQLDVRFTLVLETSYHFLAVSCALNWTAAFLVGKFFPIGTDQYIFLLFDE